ncbi:RDD family protein [Mycolicibacterium iranicum]|uniref:RDD family protein n=1 Tax=Mycolicibacterium iranicum TaxID=912594 RepID=A0ABT4HKZ0_MYCIR|nr:RDD family protein [Mycolicibacterium iranicum]MCZ0730830.1 RDD family protein [Mycolicibacterium iranicum]
MLDVSGTPTLCCGKAALNRNAYTRWLTRVGAFVIDGTPVLVGWVIWEVVAVASAPTECVTYDNGGVACTALHSPEGDIAGVLAVIVTIVYLGWNFGYRQGRSGSSLGKSVMGFRVVSENTWQPIGFGGSALRQALHLIDVALCGIGFLLPILDPRRQTLADKLMGTVCVPVWPTGTR